MENVRKYGLRGGEMGVCLKVCLPKHLREPDPDYTKLSDRRKRHTAARSAFDRSAYDRAENMPDMGYGQRTLCVR